MIVVVTRHSKISLISKIPTVWVGGTRSDHPSNCSLLFLVFVHIVTLDMRQICLLSGPSFSWLSECVCITVGLEPVPPSYLSLDCITLLDATAEASMC